MIKKTFYTILVFVILSLGYTMYSKSFLYRIDTDIHTQEVSSKTQTAYDENDQKIIINNKELKMTAILHTNKGDITIELFSNITPDTVENFLKLAKDGFYDGVKFHRVIKGFMIQGGDPLSKDDTQILRWGTGGPGYRFDDEITSQNHNDVGTISMANAGPNTNGSQFFINTANNNFLDDKHTVFGKVVQGMDIVNDIENVPVGDMDRPVEPVAINSISF